MTDIQPPAQSQLAYAGERYYHHTGRAPLFGTTLAALAVWATAAALGIAYGYTDLYAKVADLVSALIVLVFAAAGGFSVYLVMRWAKVRNTAVVAIVAVSAAILLFYVSWVAWEAALLQQDSYSPRPLRMFESPLGVWRFAQRVNENGTFTLNDRPVTGWELYSFWIGEAFLLIGATIAIPLALMRGQAFCESCGSWCKRNKDIARVQHFDEELVREHMEEKDFEYLIRLGPATPHTPTHFRVELLGCPKCKQTHLLTVNRITLSYHNGRKMENAKPVVDRLWLDAQQAEAIRELPRRMTALAQSASAPAAPVETQTQVPSSSAKTSQDQNIP